LAFLKHVAQACSDQELHLIMGNYAAREFVEVHDRLAANPPIRRISPEPPDRG
jgi:hypothetical protein